MTKDKYIDLSNFLDGKPMKRGQSLGKGISALLSDAKTPISLELDSQFNVIKIRVIDCIPSRYQARSNFDSAELEELSQSIKTDGVIQPILVRRADENKYEIVAGERRCRASALAGLEEIPAIVLRIDDHELMRIGLIENLQRKDLNVLEEAGAYKNLIDKFSYTHDEIGSLVGKTRSYISNYLRILGLPEEVLDLLRSNKITAGHGKMLVNAADPVALAKQIVEESLSVRSLEGLLQNVKEKVTTEKSPKVSNFKEEIECLIAEDRGIVDWKRLGNNSYHGLRIVVSGLSEKTAEIRITYTSLAEVKDLLGIE